ncbi:MAG: hypothetical protein NTZ51_07060 [Proteobacteria bacterium]|nr:hypothetical protein [Pseudomonadota bacterium]
MKCFRPQWFVLALAAGMLTLAAASDAMAKFKIEAQASEEGLQIKYGSGVKEKEIDRAPGDPPAEISIGKIATIEVSVLEVTEDTVLVHLVVSIPLSGQPPTVVDLPIPFGEFGVEIDIGGKKFIIPVGGYPIEASLLLTRLQTKYDIAVDLQPLFSDHWQGTKTPSDNEIHENIVNPMGDGSIDITLVLDYSFSFTKITYTIVMDSGEGGQPVPQTGTIPVPNGSYHIWADIEMPDIGMP